MTLQHAVQTVKGEIQTSKAAVPIQQMPIQALQMGTLQGWHVIFDVCNGG